MHSTFKRNVNDYYLLRRTNAYYIYNKFYNTNFVKPQHITRFNINNYTVRSVPKISPETNNLMMENKSFYAIKAEPCKQIWPAKIWQQIFPEIRMISEFAIRKSLLPWDQLHIYNTIQKRLNTTQGAIQLQSLSSIAFLSLLDLQDGLYQTLRFLNIFVHLNKLLNVFINLLTLSFLDKRRITIPSKVGSLTGARPQMKDFVQTMAFLLLPFVVYRINSKLAMERSTSCLNKIVNINYHQCFTIWPNTTDANSLINSSAHLANSTLYLDHNLLLNSDNKDLQNLWQNNDFLDEVVDSHETIITSQFEYLQNQYTQVDTQFNINYTPKFIHSTFNNIFQLHKLGLTINLKSKNAQNINQISYHESIGGARFCKHQTLSNVLQVYNYHIYLKLQNNTQLCNTWNVLNTRLEKLVTNNVLPANSTKFWWNLHNDFFLKHYSSKIQHPSQKNFSTEVSTWKSSLHNDVFISKWIKWCDFVFQCQLNLPANLLSFSLQKRELFTQKLDALKNTQIWLKLANLNTERANWLSLLLIKDYKFWQTKIDEWQLYLNNSQLENGFFGWQHWYESNENQTMKLQTDFLCKKQKSGLLYNSYQPFVKSSDIYGVNLYNYQKHFDWLQFKGQKSIIADVCNNNENMHLEKRQVNLHYDLNPYSWSNWMCFETVVSTKDQQREKHVRFNILNNINILHTNKINYYPTYLLQANKNHTSICTNTNQFCFNVLQNYITSEVITNLLSNTSMYFQPSDCFQNKYISCVIINKKLYLQNSLKIACQIQAKLLSANEPLAFDSQLLLLLQKLYNTLDILRKNGTLETQNCLMQNQDAEIECAEFLCTLEKADDTSKPNNNHAIFWLSQPLTNTFSDTIFSDYLQYEIKDFPLDNEDYINDHNWQSGLIGSTKILNPLRQEHNQLLKLRFIYYKQALDVYNHWIATSYWWQMFNKVSNNLLNIIYQNIGDNFNSFLVPKIRNLVGQPNDKYCAYSLKDNRTNNNNLLYKWNNFFFTEFQQIRNKSETIWECVQVIKGLKLTDWLFFASFNSTYTMYSSTLAISLGLAYILLWDKWNKISNSSDNPANIRLRLELIIIRLRKKWRGKTTNVDLYQKEKGIITQSFVSSKKLLDLQKNKHVITRYSVLPDYEDPSLRQTGWEYIRSLIATYHSSPNHQMRNARLRHSYKHIYYALCPNTNTLALPIIRTQYDINLNCKQENVFSVLDLKHIPTRNFFLVGPSEAGKTFLAQNIAIDTHVPVVHICFENLIYKENPSFQFGAELIQNRWFNKKHKTASASSVDFLTPFDNDDSNPFLDQLEKLLILLLLAKKLQNCIVWITSIDDLTVDEVDAERLILLLTLLDHMRSYTHIQPQIMFIACSKHVRTIDPMVFSLGTFEQLIRVSMPTHLQREQLFASFLRTKGFDIKNELEVFEIANQTRGYTLRDITGLVNEILLINISKRLSSRNDFNIKVALQRYMYGVEKTSYDSQYLTFNKQDLAYKIGKALINKTLYPLTKQNNCWKTRFYYFSNFYIEIDINKSCFSEFSILPIIYNCLSGSAARDAWIFCQNTIEKGNLVIQQEIQNEIGLASTLFAALCVDIPGLNIYKRIDKLISFVPKLELKINNFVRLKEQKISISNTTNNDEVAVNIIETPDLINKYNIHQSYRIHRLHMYRNFVFDMQNTLSTYSIEQDNATLISTKIFSPKLKNSNIKPIAFYFSKSSWKKSAPYYKKKLQEEVLQRNALKITENRTWLRQIQKSFGLPILSQYLMEYKESHIQNIYLTDQNLLANSQILNTLYQIYSTYKKKNRISDTYKFRQSPFWLLEKFQWEMELLQEKEEDSATVRWVKAELRNAKEVSREKFDFFQKLVRNNSKFHRPQILLGKNRYVFEMWVDQIPVASMARFNLLNEQETLNQKYLITMETLSHKSLLEIYNILLFFFLNNKVLMNKLINDLDQKGLIFSNK